MADAEFEDEVIRFINEIPHTKVNSAFGYAPHMLTPFIGTKRHN
jgi:hypothetical protein